MKAKAWARVLCLLLCLMTLAPLASAYGETTKVTAYLLRLREKPAADAKVLDAYPRGTRVTILKKGDTWTKVRVHGKEGYMRTDMLAYSRQKKAEEAASSSKSSSSKNTSVSGGTTAYIIKGVRLNLRDEASNRGEIIGSYRGGTEVTVLKKGKYWTLVEVRGRQGYMGTEFLTYEKEE